MRNAGLEEAQAGIKIAGRNINNLRYADDTTLMAESEELKSLLMKMKKESEKVGLKLKITADGDCSHEVTIRLLLERKVMTNLDSILKSRHYFDNKGPSIQGYGFSSGHVWM